MAKPGYPGLVQVPPSDRSLLKRRLARWSFLIISIIGGLSTLNIWLPSPDRTRDCRHSADATTAFPLRPDCTQMAQATNAAPSPQTEVITNQRATSHIPKRVAPVQSRATVSVAAAPSPKRPVDQSPTQPKPAQVATTPPANSSSDSANRTVAPLQEDYTTATLDEPLPVTSQTTTQDNPDILLAEQGDAFAQYRLGRFYAQQSGLHSPESVSWYVKASDGLRRLASAGNGKAMYVLGVMYAFGRGVVQNKEEARNWLIQAMAHQIPAAAPVLASLDKNRPADSNPPLIVQTKRRQT